jgi:hypothetical protein
LTTQEFLTNNGMTVVTHPSYSPYPTQCVFFFSQNGSCHSREGKFITSAQYKNCRLHVHSSKQTTLLMLLTIV